jgi:outer membrane protein OmpA-like peptidoglycan-associated protein
MKERHRFLWHSLTLLAAAGVTVLSSCAINPQTGQPEVAPPVKAEFVSIYDSPNPCSNNARNLGMTIGAIAGTTLGALLDRNNRAEGAGLGAVAGIGVGFLVGHLMDARRCRLYKIAKANHLRLASATITPAKLGEHGKNSKVAIGLDVQLQNKHDEFRPGSATLTPRAQAYMAQIAQQYTPQAIAASLQPNATPEQRAAAQRQIVLIVGHTNAEDAAAGVNLARLSQARAKAVADVFAENGVPPANIYYQGAGDALPIAPNATEQGRAENNRVQFIDVPTRYDLQRFLQARTINPMDYQTSSAPAVHAPPPTATLTQSAPAIPTAQRPPQQIAAVTRSAAREAVHRTKTRLSRLIRKPQVKFASCCDFGGNPIHLPAKPINLGMPIEHSIFGIFPAAEAAEPVMIGSCLRDHPHPTTAVRNLQTGEVLPPRDFVPGFYGTVWASYVNGNLVAIDDATVPLDSGAPVPEPTVYIYKNYRGNVHQPPSFKARAAVNVYRGTEKMVYRVFLHGPAQCIDLVVPAAQFRGSGDLYYDRSGDLYRATAPFAMQR